MEFLPFALEFDIKKAADGWKTETQNWPSHVLPSSSPTPKKSQSGNEAVQTEQASSGILLNGKTDDEVESGKG